MFSGCISLIETPILPATTLVNSCYKCMFDGCVSLNKVTMLATDVSATDCLNSWLLDVSSIGIFTKALGMILLFSNISTGALQRDIASATLGVTKLLPNM